MLRNGIARSYGISSFSFVRKLHVVLHNGYTNFYSHQQGKEGSFFSTLSPAFTVYKLLTMAILARVKGYLTVLLICISLNNNLWKILKEIGIPDHLTYLLRNLYADQEATGRMDMEQQTGSK